jgi:hypothetical protein
MKSNQINLDHERLLHLKTFVCDKQSNGTSRDYSTGFHTNIDQSYLPLF